MQAALHKNNIVGFDTIALADKEDAMKLQVIGENTRISEALHDFVARRLYFALGRFAQEIQRVTVRVGDVNGPRGGVDKQCRVEIKLRGLDSVLSEGCGHDFESAAAFAAGRAGRSVARALDRRRAKRRRPGTLKTA